MSIKIMSDFYCSVAKSLTYYYFFGQRSSCQTTGKILMEKCVIASNSSKEQKKNTYSKTIKAALKSLSLTLRILFLWLTSWSLCQQCKIIANCRLKRYVFCKSSLLKLFKKLRQTEFFYSWVFYCSVISQQHFY